MRNKWFKRALPIIALLLLAPWPVTQVYAHSGDAASQDAVQMKVAKVTEATNTATEDAITTLEEVLPSHVYVLNNREIVTEETWHEMRKSQDTVEKPSSQRETASPAGTITASVTGMPSRRIVVDENDRIVGIWSNTTGTKRDFYSLRVKEESLQGPEHLFTQEILAQYNRLLGEVDWTETGQVYSITTTDYAN